MIIIKLLPEEVSRDKACALLSIGGVAATSRVTVEANARVAVPTAHGKADAGGGRAEWSCF